MDRIFAKATAVGVAILGLAIMTQHSEPRPRISGSLSPSDVAQIKRIARGEWWGNMFTAAASIKTIRWLPSSIHRYWADDIQSIDASVGGSVEVTMEAPSGRPKNHRITYRLKRGSKGWEVIDRYYLNW
jgi:hypothetical protein